MSINAILKNSEPYETPEVEVVFASHNDVLCQSANSPIDPWQNDEDTINF